MTEITLPGHEFLAALAQVKYAMAKDGLHEKRLCGVHILVDERSCKIEATDGHRNPRVFLSARTCSGAVLDLTIPRAYVGDLLKRKALAGIGQTVTLVTPSADEADEQAVVASVGSSLKWSSFDPFPVFGSLWPSEEAGWLAFEVEPFRAALRIVRGLAEDKRNIIPVALRFPAPGLCRVESERAEYGDVVTEVPFQGTAATDKLGLNARYLLDAIDSLHPRPPALGLLTRDEMAKPVVLVWPPSPEPRAEHLLMPLKIEWGAFE